MGTPWRPRQPRIGVCYYPEQWHKSEWRRDASAMRDAGISLVRIAEFAWSRIEPSPGEFDFRWLDEAVAVLQEAGLRIIMCTPTATPPRWMLEQHPDLLPVDAHGQPRAFGSRRHYCFSHIGYRRESRRIANLMAQRYGEHPAVVAWQTDNEFGCHDTVLSYSAAAADGFRQWLRERYGDIDALNEAWGNAFWSMDYRDFAEVDPPRNTVTEANPSHRLDFWRYSSDQVALYNRSQAEELRRLSPGRALMHNYMGRSQDFDHRATGGDLDVAGWDSYPLGFAQWLHAERPDDRRMQRYMRLGDPDFQAFHHDLYRGIGKGRMWVVEQQPGPVNWAAANPLPSAGALRLWAYEAIAHGAEVVSYFRWRQAPFAQEQMHAGLMLPDGREPAPGLAEVRQLTRELGELHLDDTHAAPVALLHDYEASWYSRIQPQAGSYSYLNLMLDAYRALRRNGADVDIVGPDASLNGYRLVIAPGLEHVSTMLAHRLARFEGELILGPRCGAKTEHFHIPPGLPPAAMTGLTGLRVLRVDSLPRGHHEAFQWNGRTYSSHTWREQVESDDAAVAAQFADGLGALWRCGRVHYLACWPDQAFLRDFFADRMRAAGIDVEQLPTGVRGRRRGELRFLFNYGPDAIDLPATYKSAEFLLGGPHLESAGVAAVALRLRP